MKIGDLVCVHSGSVPELEQVAPTEWFALSTRKKTPMVFMGWVEEEERTVIDPGWANLLHPDGTTKIVHCDFFTKVSHDRR